MLLTRGVNPGPNENLDEYLGRVRLPRRVVSHYLLPIMSAVAMCSPQELLAFPANDVVEYRRLIASQKDYVVCGGVSQVQKVLMGDLDIRTQFHAVWIEPKDTGGVQIVTAVK